MSDPIEVTAATTPKIYPPLQVPSPSPKVGINDPGFEKLTTAEKLNDSNYRKLVYQAYPDEPTCACEPMKDNSRKISSNDESIVSKSRDENLLVCRSGCKRNCCSGMRQSVVASSCRDDANKYDNNKVTPPFMPTYCVANSRENGRGEEYDEDASKKGKRTSDNGDYCHVENRLRGGGEGGEVRRGEKGMYLHYGDASRTAIGRFDDAWNGRNDCILDRRLEGGGGADVGFEYVERHPLNRSFTSDSTKPCYNEEKLHGGYPRGRYFGEQAQDSHLNTINVCGSLPDSYTPIAARCCCPGKENLMRSMKQRENGKSCSKKNSPSFDCLVKALRETQEFVESLGKVPGLPGLGLMDPADSPYFGRVRTKESNCEGMKSKAAFSELTRLLNPQCTGPCNSQMLKSTSAGQYGGATPFTIAVPGRVGVVREAVPSMPEPGLTFLPGKFRTKDDKDKMKGTDPSIQLPSDIVTGPPCGEPRCKSKRKDEASVQDSPAAVETDEELAKKIVTAKNSRTSHRIKGINKPRTSRGSSVNTGRVGDRNGRKKSSGKSGRRVCSFVYSAGDTYSGSTCGHKYCIEERHRVPSNMGWLWNIDQKIGNMKPRPGWRPGAIGRRLKAILREAKANLSHHQRSKTKSSRSSSRSRSRSAPSSHKRSRPHGDRGSVKRAQSKKGEEEAEIIEPPPTLHIHRKDGTYYVTMYPIKQETMDVPRLEEPMKPLQFKIAKNKDDVSVASSSTASDMEIEFSPPAAVNRYHKKPNVIHVNMQVNQREIIDAFKTDGSSKAIDKKKGKKRKK